MTGLLSAGGEYRNVTRSENGPLRRVYSAPPPMSRLTDAARADARTITVTVTYFADLRRFLPRGCDGPQPFTVREGATVADLLAAIGIEPGAEVTAAVEGELAQRDTPLHDGADVMLLSPMEGG